MSFPEVRRTAADHGTFWNVSSRSSSNRVDPSHRAQIPSAMSSSSSTSVDLEAVLATSIRVAREAGAFLRKEVLKRRDGTLTGVAVSTEKDNAVDIVTAADMAVEALILTSLKNAFPGFKFIGEETYAKSQERKFLLTDDPTWIVDPIDGTVNYTHLYPMVAVSIGFCLNKEAVVGVILAPFLGGDNGTMWFARRGGGSHISYDGGETSTTLPLAQPPPPIPSNAPAGCVLVVEWGKDRRDNGNLPRKINTFWNLAGAPGARNGLGGMVHGVRSNGSATLDMALIAAGSGDIFWEGGCWEWDICAGVAILEEAGGIVVDSNPPKDDDTTKPIPKASLGGRRYLAIRPCSGTEGETARQAQERLVREVWKRVEPLDYDRPM